MLRVSVFIDANNFKNRVHEAISFRPDINFEFKKFINHIVGPKRDLVCATYYTSLPENQYLSQQPYKSEQILINTLKKSKDCRVESGFYDVEHSVEKGTDINLATDMLVGAFNNSYDVAIIVSADQDYKKVINTIKSTGKVVELALPERARAGELVKCTDYFSRLSDSDLKSFWKPGTGPLQTLQPVQPNT